MKPIYTAVNAAAARAALDELTETWGARYGAIIRLWENAWEEFIPFLDYDIEIRTVICSTNAIESLNARYRRGVKARGHFPTELAALKSSSWSPSRSTLRHRPGPVDDAVEAGTERVRHHLADHFPAACGLLTQPPETPLTRQTRRRRGADIGRNRRRSVARMSRKCGPCPAGTRSRGRPFR